MSGNTIFTALAQFLVIIPQEIFSDLRELSNSFVRSKSSPFSAASISIFSIMELASSKNFLDICGER
jgi:hypothetical protein